MSLITNLESINSFYNKEVIPNPFTDKELAEIESYVQSKTKEKFLRKQKTGLPYTIECVGEKEVFVHTRKTISGGGNKTLFLSIELFERKAFGRMKPNYSPTIITEEAKLIESFKGKRGIIEIYHLSTYLGKKEELEKKAMILELYSGTLGDLYEHLITAEEVELIVIDLIYGLFAIHEKGFIHGDLKPANILFQIDPKTRKVVKAVICDLGEVTDGHNCIPPFTPEKLKENQRMEVDHVLGLLTALHRHQKLKTPSYFKELRVIPDFEELRDKGIMPRSASTAKEALEKTLLYYSLEKETF